MRQSRANPHTDRFWRSSATSRAHWLWPLLCLASGAGVALFAWPFLVDDAFIIARYASRLARGASYTFNDGAPTDGVTGPLWLLPLVVGTRLGGDPLLAAKGLGWLLAATSTVLGYKRLRARANGVASTFAFGLLTATSAPLWIWSIGGLETGAATLAASCVLFGATSRPTPGALRVGAGAAALAWLRPELALLVLCALLLVWSRSRRAAALAIVLAALGALALLLFRFSYFGALLPLSAHAKPASLANGVAYVLRSVATPAALVLLPSLVLTLRWGRRDDRALIALVLVHAAAIVLAGGDWMPGARLFVPVVPALCCAAAVGLARLWLRHRALGVCLILLMVSVRGVSLAAEAAHARAAGEAREQRLPELLRALEGEADPVALLDIGAIGYVTGRSLIDLGGLTEPVVAYAPGGHVAKHLDSAWLSQRAPGAIVLHSAQRPRVDSQGRVRWFAGYPVERRVLAMPWVWSGYRVKASIEYQPAYFYLVLTPRGSNSR